MYKQNKNGGQKSLVRNTEQKIPNVLVRTEPTKLKTLGRTKPDVEKFVTNRKTVKFDEPKPNSSKGILEKMRAVENIKPDEIKNAPPLIEQRITKQMNFPYEKSIYKDLIPLCVKMQTQPMLVSRDPLPLKDKEPVLSDFFTPRTIPEYIFQASNNASDNKIENAKFNGVKLYSQIQSWCET